MLLLVTAFCADACIAFILGPFKHLVEGKTVTTLKIFAKLAVNISCVEINF